MNNGMTQGAPTSPQLLTEEAVDKRDSISETETIHSLVNEIKDLYSAEERLTMAIPEMLKKANVEDLIEGLTRHLRATKDYISQLEEISAYVNKKTINRKYEEMEELIRETEEIMEYVDQRILLNIEFPAPS